MQHHQCLLLLCLPPLPLKGPAARHLELRMPAHEAAHERCEPPMLQRARPTQTHERRLGAHARKRSHQRRHAQVVLSHIEQLLLERACASRLEPGMQGPTDLVTQARLDADAQRCEPQVAPERLLQVCVLCRRLRRPARAAGTATRRVDEKRLASHDEVLGGPHVPVLSAPALRRGQDDLSRHERACSTELKHTGNR